MGNAYYLRSVQLETRENFHIGVAQPPVQSQREEKQQYRRRDNGQNALLEHQSEIEMLPARGSNDRSEGIVIL